MLCPIVRFRNQISIIAINEPQLGPNGGNVLISRFSIHLWNSNCRRPSQHRLNQNEIIAFG
jgi:hypothetical protein